MPEPEAWIAMPSEAELRAMMPPGQVANPYDFGFLPAMTRLILAHPRIGRAFAALYAQIMFAPGQLERREREMIAAIAAAAQDCHY